MPTTEPATHVASVPETMVFHPSDTISSRRSGAMVASLPINPWRRILGEFSPRRRPG